MQIGGVTGRYMAGGGATPVRCTYRVGSAALVAPPPATSTIQTISSADIERIYAGYEMYQLNIHDRFTNDHNLIHRRTP